MQTSTIIVVSITAVFCAALVVFWLILSFLCICKGSKKPADEPKDTDPLLSAYDIPSTAHYNYTSEDLAYIKQTGHFLVQAQYDFAGSSSGSSELTFKANQYIWVTNAEEHGWWVGKIYGTNEEGYFPSTYIQTLPAPR